MPSTNSIPPDANSNITLSTLVEALADDFEIGKTSEYHPTSGRVLKDSEDGTIYLADGTSWNDVSSAIGIDTPRTQIVEAFVGKNPVQRPVLSESDTTVNVPADYSTIQAALNDIPLILRHNYTVNVDDGTYNEDVTVGPVTLHAQGASISLTGNTATPSNVALNAVAVMGVTGGRCVIEGFELQSDHASSDVTESTPFFVGYSNEVVLKDVNYAGGTDGIMSYGGYVHVNTVDFGSSVLTGNGMYTKHGGTIQEETAVATPASGTVGNIAYVAGGGPIYIDGQGSTLTGSSGDFGGTLIIDQTNRSQHRLVNFPDGIDLEDADVDNVRILSGQSSGNFNIDSGGSGNDIIFRDSTGTLLVRLGVSNQALRIENGHVDYRDSTSYDDTDDSMTADPETASESGYIEVKVGGSIKQVPFYDP